MVSQSIVRQFRFGHGAVVPLAIALAVMALGTLAPTVLAGEEAPPLIDFRVVKADCDEAPAEGEPPVTERLPEGCAFAAGVTFTIAVEGGETLECTTNADGFCLVQVPSESMVTVTEDESTATDGYTPLENPIETQAVTEFAGAIFVNVRDDEPPTTGLPDTGSGATLREMTQGAAGTLIALATLLAVGGLVVRRPGMR